MSNINQQHNNLLFVVEFLRIRECLSLSIWIRFCSLSTASLGPSNSLPLSSCRLDSWKLANGLSNRWEKRAVTWRAFYIFYIFFFTRNFHTYTNWISAVFFNCLSLPVIVWCFFKMCWSISATRLDRVHNYSWRRREWSEGSILLSAPCSCFSKLINSNHSRVSEYLIVDQLLRWHHTLFLDCGLCNWF